MQIHELNRPRRTDEGFMDVVKGVGKAAATGLAQAVSPGVGTTQDFRASSAGILDPKQKLAAVMKNSEMARIATGYADEWVKKQAQAVPEDTAVAAPGTYNKKTGAAKLGGKTMTALSDLPPAVQQQIQAKQQELEKQTGQPNPNTIPTKPVAGTSAPNTINAPGFNYNNIMKMPGMEKYATPATATDASAQTSPAAGGRINKANPNNPNIKDQNKYVQGRAGSGVGGAATKFAKYDPATSATANAAQGINNMVRSGVAAQQPGAPTTPATTPSVTPNFAGPAGFDKTTAKVNGVPAVTQPTMPGTAPAGQTQPAAGSQTPANPYIKNFLEFANEKVAMRDSATYKMLGLTDAEGSKLGPELDAAKEKVKAAQGNPAATKTAVKNYILTAMAALQLVASQNAVKAASPEAPAYGQQPAPAGKAGQPGAAAGTAPATGQLTGSNAVALLTKAGLTAQILTTAGQKIQTATGNKQLSTTGDSVIDTMLEGMGYTVS